MVEHGGRCAIRHEGCPLKIAELQPSLANRERNQYDRRGQQPTGIGRMFDDVVKHTRLLETYMRMDER